MWKIGQKLVCIKECGYGVSKKPIVGEIYECDGFITYELLGVSFAFVYLNGFHEIVESGNRVGFALWAFRPVDETFGEEVAEKLEKEFISQPEPALV